MTILLSTTPSRLSIGKRWPVLGLLVALCLVWTLVHHSATGRLAGEAQIRALHKMARAEHDAVLARQSTTLDAAKAEYARRYQLSPPPGYDQWFAYAQSRRSPLIDEFDALMSDLRPWQQFLTSSCDKSANRVLSESIVHLCVANNNITVDGWNSGGAKYLVDTMTELAPELPDLCLAVNTLDLSRTVLNHATLASLYGPSPPTMCEFQHFKDLSRVDIWPEIIQSCSADAAARADAIAIAPVSPHSMMTSWEQATDLCSRGSAPASGIVHAPQQAKISNVVRPILSHAKLSTFHDVLYPGQAHFRAASEAPLDYKHWEDKRSMLGWRGTSDGGHATILTWREYQRQQMVKEAHARPLPAPPPRTRETRLQGREPRGFTKPLPTYRDLLDFEFTDFTSCDAPACDAMRKEFGAKPVTDANEPFDSKLVLSMDGTSADEELYKKLKSNSAVVRQGLMREWHDDRLVPWLHYIPLSMEATELPALATFLLGRGDAIAKTIADEGRHWAGRALRREDLGVYIYRLLIEMGRRTY